MTDKIPDEIYISQDREYPDTFRDVSWGFENAPLKYISEQKHAEKIAALKAEHHAEISLIIAENQSLVNAMQLSNKQALAGLCDELEKFLGEKLFCGLFPENYPNRITLNLAMSSFKQKLDRHIQKTSNSLINQAEDK